MPTSTPPFKSRLRAGLVSAAVVVAAAVGTATVMGASTGGGAGLPALGVLDREPGPGDRLATPFWTGGQQFREEDARLAVERDGVKAYVAPAVDGDRVCLIVTSGEGPQLIAANTCNPASVMEDWGGIPLIMQLRDGSLRLAALVPDGFDRAQADAGSSGAAEVKGNVALLPISPGTKAVTVSGSAGSRALPVAQLLEGSPAS